MTDIDPDTSPASTAPIVTRRARPDELAAIAPIFRHADRDYADLPDGAPNAAAVDAAALADLRVLAAHPDGVWVAERDGSVVGFAAAAIRGRLWHLAYLFVEPTAQGHGVGGALAQAIHTAGAAAGCDVFTTEPSADDRALRCYFRLGMLPRPPAALLRARSPLFPPLLRDDGLEAMPLAADDDSQLETLGDLDALTRGGRRPEDLRRWLRDGGRGALLLRRETGAPAGYAVARPVDAGVWRLGPVAAVDAAAFALVLERALAMAGSVPAPHAIWLADVPGENHGALRRLLAAGFAPIRLAPLLASGPTGRWDAYLFGDLDVL
ncbi:MAG: GNAT family N-acetyltransferase [Thermomicrobiales bacterium]|nr:GNAT family N-acetyltransferase [Thermomicrobiales bacterium]